MNDEWWEAFRRLGLAFVFSIFPSSFVSSLAAVDTSSMGVSLLAAYFLHFPPIAASLLAVLPLAVFAPIAAVVTSAVGVLLLAVFHFFCLLGLPRPWECCGLFWMDALGREHCKRNYWSDDYSHRLITYKRVVYSIRNWISPARIQQYYSIAACSVLRASAYQSRMSTSTY